MYLFCVDLQTVHNENINLDYNINVTVTMLIHVLEKRKNKISENKVIKREKRNVYLGPGNQSL